MIRLHDYVDSDFWKLRYYKLLLNVFYDTLHNTCNIHTKRHEEKKICILNIMQFWHFYTYFFSDKDLFLFY